MTTDDALTAVVIGVDHALVAQPGTGAVLFAFLAIFAGLISEHAFLVFEEAASLLFANFALLTIFGRSGDADGLLGVE